MNIQAILHIPKSNYAFAYKENELYVRIRTAKDDIDKVNIIYFCKFDIENKKIGNMKKILSDEYFDYYEYVIIEKDTRLGYYFELIKGDEDVFLYEDSFQNGEDKGTIYNRHFQYPTINKVDVHEVPDWVNEAVFYQIFPERFHTTNSGVKNKKLTEWNKKPKSDSFFGGDLQGIIEKLPYLNELGINGFYLTPVFKSPSNHKYDTSDYMEIDEHFGTKETFKILVDKAHSMGMKVVLDAVFNHCGKDFAPFQDVLLNGEKSIYKDWFYIESYPVTLTKPTYKMFGFVPEMPKLNTSNPQAKKYLLEVARYWVSEFNIDGWRLDVSDEIDHAFWRDFRKTVKDVNPNAIIIGENWHDSTPWLIGDQFDSVMNYPITNAATKYFGEKTVDAKGFEQQVATALFRNTKQVNFAMLNLLDSHDTARFLNLCNENKKMLLNAAAFILTFIGIPCTYYGTEIGLTGSGDPDCRRTFDWNRDNWDMNIWECYQKLIAMRQSQKALKYGDILMQSTKEVFIMKRNFEDETIYTLINNTEKVQTVLLKSKSGTSEFSDLLTNEHHKSNSIKIGAQSFGVFKEIK